MRLSVSYSLHVTALASQPLVVPQDQDPASAPYRGPDRRRRPTPFLSRYTFFGGRRSQAGRRSEDEREVFVDVHGSWLFLVVVAIVALNFLDAFFTIYFLSHGGQELNPLVDAVLRVGIWPFVALKSVGIGICVAVLTVAKNFKTAKFGLGVVLGGYTVLLGWHLWLFAHVA